MDRLAASPTLEVPRWRWLPPQGTWKYHALLGALGILVLGPLGGVTASYMNFSLGFFVGGQVLAGILGSTVTYGYGADGKHGANYLQTAAASVAAMSGMGVLIQAMVWMGMAQPPAWQMVLFLLCIGMFGAGVGMLYTPILVDRLQLTFPSGLAVANILRALTDPVLLRRFGAPARRRHRAGHRLGPGGGQGRRARRDRAVGLDLRRRHGGRRAHRHPGRHRRPARRGAGAVFRLDRLAAGGRSGAQDHLPDRASA